MSTNKDFEEFLECLNQKKVRYLIVGAYAVAFYTRPRFTKDIDILVDTSSENRERIIKALEDFGFGDIGLSPSDFQTGYIIQLGVAPNRIDIMCSIEGVEIESAWDNRIKGYYGNEEVFFIGLKDLIKAKQTSAREQDRLDLRQLLLCLHT